MPWWYNNQMALHRSRAALLVLLAALLGSSTAVSPVLAASPSKIPDAPPRSEGDAVPVRTLYGARAAARRASSLATAGDTVWVWRDSLETLSSPSNEGGWTHIDNSAQPTAWHIDTLYACTGHSFWCGRVDSSWTWDPDRMGYGNGWTQYLENYVDLSNSASPRTLSFRHQMDTEASFDFGFVEIFDPDASWTPLATFTGSLHGTGGAACDTVTITLPDSTIAKYNPVLFRFTFTSDATGSDEDGLFTGDGWSVDNVTVMAGTTDLRFFDDFESGPGTWTVSVFPPVGDYWHLVKNVQSEQVCTTNSSNVWSPLSPISGSLVPRQDDFLITPPQAVNRADQVFTAFDVYRDLPLNSCYYYNLRYRTRNVGDLAWSLWQDPTGLLYFGTEREWMRQTIGLPGAGGKDSVQVRFDIRDYSSLYCGGIGNPGGTAVYFDNAAIGVIGLAGPSIAASEIDLFNDTFQTSTFYADDNFNTARGDTVSVRIGASRGLQSANLWYSLNGGSFSSLPLTRGPTAVTGAYYGDVPAGAYPRGTELRYYFSATDSLNASVTLPSDALTANDFYTATILPAIHTGEAFCTSDTANVLYVNAAYGSSGGPTLIDQSLTALGLSYDRFDVNAPQLYAGNTPGGATPGDLTQRWPATSAATLSMYRAIVWDFGDRAAGTLSPGDQQLLQAWLATTGKSRGLLVSGDNVAYDLTVNQRDIGTFLSCTMGTTFLRDLWENTPQDSLTPVLVGAPGTAIGGTLMPFSAQCPSLNQFDALAASTCNPGKTRPWILYPNSLMAGVERYDSLGTSGDSVKTVMFGAGLGETIGNVPRNLLLWFTVVKEFKTPYCYVPTGVEETAGAAPAARPMLYPAAPNPFNPETAIRFSLPRRASVRVLVFNVAGARVRSLAEGVMEAGPHSLRWDGRDDRGRDLPSGAYFYRLEAEGVADARKLILLR